MTPSNGCWTTPEFRPDAPAAMTDRSYSRTVIPASTRNAAVAVPTTPPPMIATSTADAVTRTGTAAPARSARRRGNRPGTSGDSAQRFEQSIDLGRRVVMRQPDADDAAAIEEAQSFHQAGGVEVAVPDGDPLSAER